MGALDKLKSYLQKSLNPRAIEARRLAFLNFFNILNKPEPDLRALMEYELNSAVVGRCIEVKAEDCSEPPIRLFQGTPNNRGAEVLSHALLDFLQKPSPDIGKKTWWEYLYADFDSTGDHFSYIYLDKKGLPLSTHRFRPDEIDPQPDLSGARNIGHYKWDTQEGNGFLGVVRDGSRDIPWDRMIHIRRRHPFTMLRGYGNLARLRHYLLMDEALSDFDWNRWSQGIPTEYIIFFNGVFQPGQREQIEDKLNRKFRGPKGEPYMLIEANESGDKSFEVERFPTMTEKDLMTLEKEQRIMYRISMAFGVPPSKLQDFSQSTRVANAEAMERMYWEDSIKANHGIVLDYFNSVFIPRFYGKGLFIEYDYSQVRALQQSALEMAQIHTAYLDQGVISRNEVRETIGFARVDDPMMDAHLYMGRELGFDPFAGLLGMDSGVEDDEEVDDGTVEEDDDSEDGLSDDDEEQLRASGKLLDFKGRKQFINEPILDLNEEKEIFDRMVREKIRLMVQRSGQQHLKLSNVEGVFDVKDPKVLEFVDHMTVKLVEDVVTNTDSMVRAAVAEAIDDGLGVPEMRSSLQDAFKVRREPWQLDRIARTETHQAQEGGSWHASRQNGVEFKRWLTARDSKVRGLDPRDAADHDGIEQMGPIPLEAPFVDPRSQARMQYPGDRSGAMSAGDTINCRCTWISDFSHLDLWANAPNRKGFDEVWYEKAARRTTMEMDMRRTVKRYLLGMERRALERFDAQMNKPKSRRNVR